MRKTVIIKTGDTFPGIAARFGDFEEWIINSLGYDQDQVRVVNVEKGASLPDVTECNGAVIAGSHAMVTQDLDWSLKIESWVPGAVKEKIPLLGICYGHQLIAKALGGKVGYHPGGIEIGSVKIKRSEECEQDRLFKGLPLHFFVHACHSQTVVTLPPDAVVLASNPFEPHHAFRIGGLTWGVQFHPEYDESIMKAYIDNMVSDIKMAGRKGHQIMDQVVETPEALRIIRRFARLIGME